MNDFDICLMNPPYDNNLHLKFVDKCLEVSEQVINISPNDCFTNMNVGNKLSKKLSNYIETMDTITTTEAGKQFGIWSSSNLGITLFKQNAKGYKPKFSEIQQIIEKIRKEKSIRSSLNFYKGQNKVSYDYFLSVQGDYGYAKSWHYSLDDLFNGDCNSRMGFDSNDELNNFITSVKNCWPYKLMYIVDDNAAVIAHLPFMKDYTKPWTDDRFYEYFDINKAEQQLIEDFINKNYHPKDNKLSTKKLKENLNV